MSKDRQHTARIGSPSGISLCWTGCRRAGRFAPDLLALSRPGPCRAGAAVCPQPRPDRDLSAGADATGFWHQRPFSSRPWQLRPGYGRQDRDGPCHARGKAISAAWFCLSNKDDTPPWQGTNTAPWRSGVQDHRQGTPLTRTERRPRRAARARHPRGDKRSCPLAGHSLLSGQTLRPEGLPVNQADWAGRLGLTPGLRAARNCAMLSALPILTPPDHRATPCRGSA